MNKSIALNKLIALAVVLGMSASAVQAMPPAPGQTGDNLVVDNNLVVKIAGGCGMGFHRGPGGGCRPNGGGPAVVVAPGAVIVEPGAGPCGGMGRHRVCNADGRCAMVCN
jgi:hypothetical protein